MTHSPAPATWPADALSRFGAADEIQISTRRPDGSPRAFVPSWIVAVTDALYVRSYRGARGAWYRQAIQHPAGAIRAGGHQADVILTPLGPQQRDTAKAIGDAYRSKYARYGDTYLQPMLAGQAVAATLQLTPSANPSPPAPAERIRHER
jgi:hypothetical protein